MRLSPGHSVDRTDEVSLLLPVRRVCGTHTTGRGPRGAMSNRAGQGSLTARLRSDHSTKLTGPLLGDGPSKGSRSTCPSPCLYAGGRHLPQPRSPSVSAHGGKRCRRSSDSLGMPGSQTRPIRATLGFPGQKAVCFKHLRATRLLCLGLFRDYRQVPDIMKIISLCFFLITLSLYTSGRAEWSGRVCLLISNLNFLGIPLKLDTDQNVSQVAVIPGGQLVGGQGLAPAPMSPQGLSHRLFVSSLSESSFHPLSKRRPVHVPPRFGVCLHGASSSTWRPKFSCAQTTGVDCNCVWCVQPRNHSVRAVPLPCSNVCG